MPVITCCKCEESVLKPDGNPPELCVSCKVGLEREINMIDRKNDRYTKRGKLKNRFYNIPDEAIPQRMALHIEEVATPEIENRQHCIGRMDELKVIGSKEIHDIDTDFSEGDRGKITLKKRYR